MSIEFDGLDDVDGRLASMGVNVDGASRRSLRDSGTHLLSESVMLAPVETGDLRGSGNMVETEDGVEVRFQTRYAAVQHEALHFNHPRGGQAKYLEQPLEANRQRYLQHLRDSIQREIG